MLSKTHGDHAETQADAAAKQPGTECCMVRPDIGVASVLEGYGSSLQGSQRLVRIVCLSVRRLIQHGSDWPFQEVLVHDAQAGAAGGGDG